MEYETVLGTVGVGSDCRSVDGLGAGAADGMAGGLVLFRADARAIAVVRKPAMGTALVLAVRSGRWPGSCLDGGNRAGDQILLYVRVGGDSDAVSGFDRLSGVWNRLEFL